MKSLVKHTTKVLLLFALVFIGSACTEGFDNLNVSPTAVQQDRVDENLLFTRSLVYGALRYTEFQRAQQLYANHYVQYYSVAVDYFQTGRYISRNDWSTAYWNAAYSDFGMQAQQVIEVTSANPEKVNKTAIARIWKVFIMHRLTDFFGDIPYTEAFSGDITPAYDTQESIYIAMLEELDLAVQSFDQSKTLGFGSADVIYGGNIAKWIAFANSLRLRLAMRVSEVAPTLAEEHVRAVISDGRLIADVRDGAIMPYGRDFGNATENLQPMAILRSFNEYRVSTTLLDFLQENQDPRLPMYVEPIESGEYVGLQNGLNPEEINDINRDDYSKESLLISNQYAPTILLGHAEVEFLLAEAAVRGWNAADAKTHYDNGVRSAIEFWVNVNENLRTRIAESDAAALPDVELASDAISNYLAQPNIAFNSANAIEQIITQKWLANISQGFESWAEYRRTGFPRLNPIPNTDGLSETGGSTPPSRVRYPIEEETLNGANYDAAVARQGADLMTTKIWWDVKD